MQQTGEVISTQNGVATVKFKRSKQCGKCKACLSFSSDELLVELENTLDAKPGDKVEIMLHESTVVKASLIMYGIPLVALILGVYLGSLVSDLLAALSGIALALLSFSVLRLFEPKFSHMDEFKPRMLCFCESTDENKEYTEK